MAARNPELRRQVIAIYKGQSVLSRHQGTRVTDRQAGRQVDKDKRTDAELTRRSTESPELLNLGRDYPQGYAYFRPRLHKAFMANAHLQDEEQIRQGIARADFVKKGASPTMTVPHPQENNPTNPKPPTPDMAFTFPVIDTLLFLRVGSPR